MKLTKAIIAELKEKHLPKLRAVTFLKPENDSPESLEAMSKADEYFSHFMEQVPGGPCVCCGKPQGAKDLVDALFGQAQFTWGLAHGEGFCRACGYPARAHHDVPGLGMVSNLILQYHPDELEDA